MMMQFSIHWVDGEREPQCPANPSFPSGVDVDLAQGRPSCKRRLPYPAPRCGAFIVECQLCGANALITTAGRADDPRSIKLACKER